MAELEVLVGLILAGVLLAALARRVGAPYPVFLAVGGALLAFVPGAPSFTVLPELALALFVAPILLDAAYDASPRDLRENLAAIVSMAVVMVVLTVAAVACAARLVVPGMGWATAITLGAIVAPPDASAASAVLRRLQPPHRLLVILEGESLFNDATALLVYRAAVVATVTGAFSAWSLVPMLAVTCGGGLIAGWALARFQIWLAARVDDIPINVMLQFTVTFAVWILAERVGLSAIITVVAYAMTIARRVAGRMGARRRIASYAVWEVAVMVLNVLAFVLIGLQLRGILSRLERGDWDTYALCAASVCAAVVLARIGWTMMHTVIGRWWRGRNGQPRPTMGGGLLASWCGMRGIVTLAAALALPVGPSAFPHRDLIVFCAFCVVLATLVVQGMTLRPLMSWLRLEDDGSVGREVELARAETARAALRVLADAPASYPAAVLGKEYEARLRAAEAGASPAAMEEGAASVAALQLRAVQAQRESLTELRARRAIGDDAFHVVEEEIDLLELSASGRVRPTIDGDPA